MQPKEQLVDLADIWRQDVQVGVTEARTREAYGRHIQYFQATPEEIEAWYYADDPTGHSMWMQLDIAGAANDGAEIERLLGEVVSKSMLAGRGGLALLAGSLFPQAFETPDDRQWFQRVNDQYYQSAAESGIVPAGEMDAHGLLEFCEGLTARDIAYDPKDFQRLYLAAEMLVISTIEIQNLWQLGVLVPTGLTGEAAERWVAENDAFRDNRARTILAGITPEELDTVVQKQNVISDRLLNMLTSYGLADWPEGYFEDEQSDEIKMLGLKAQALYASSWMADTFEDRQRYDNSKIAFERLTFALQHVFGETSEPITQRLKAPHIKGPLHEILWTMDAYVMRMIDPAKYGHVRAIPTYSRHDAPRIGYPEQRRGFDVTVIAGEIYDYIQLKSSPNKHNGYPSRTEQSRPERPAAIPAELWENDDYHPAIVVLQEPNFLETNPRRLIAKLNAYRRWVESDFDPEEGQKLQKYILPTVKEEFEAVTQRTIDRTMQLRRAMAEGIIKPGLHRLPEQKMAKHPEMKKVVAQAAPGQAVKRKAARKAAKKARQKQRSSR